MNEKTWDLKLGSQKIWFSHGFPNIIVAPGDMRAEIQQAVGLLKTEAESAAKNPLASKLQNVAENLQNVEKDWPDL